ncbi:MAG: hypothetical protein IT427_16145 [Pirellulales bacterium]|nr:hypothetical protein [Pirellulales bacterium]
MEKTKTTDSEPKLRILRSADPKTIFGQMTPAEILKKHGLPKFLLGTSLKTEKSRSVGVLARVLYFTPGVFCPNATQGCLAACLGHSSGRMQMPTHALARDRRTALYVEKNQLFLQMLTVELSQLEEEARRLGLIPAVRLNGSSDLPWKRLHPELFAEFPNIHFFDYTKVPSRMVQFLNDPSWPKNYHLTFSAQPGNHDEAYNFLAQGGTVAVVFWPDLPHTHWGTPVTDGDKHDARFLDQAGTIVGLKAKGQAKNDTTGFVIRTSSDKAPSKAKNSRQAKQPEVTFAIAA